MDSSGTIDLSVTNGDKGIKSEVGELFCSYCKESLLRHKGDFSYNHVAMVLDNDGDKRLVCGKCAVKAFDKLLR